MGSTLLGICTGAGDESLVDRFLALSPNSAEQVKQFLSVIKSKKWEIGTLPSHRHFYDAASRTAFYVTVHQQRLNCINVLNVAKDAANKIEAALNQNSIAWTALPSFQDVVEEVLGESINPEHPKGCYLASWWQPP